MYHQQQNIAILLFVERVIIASLDLNFLLPIYNGEQLHIMYYIRINKQFWYIYSHKNRIFSHIKIWKYRKKTSLNKDITRKVPKTCEKTRKKKIFCFVSFEKHEICRERSLEDIVAFVFKNFILFQKR